MTTDQSTTTVEVLNAEDLKIAIVNTLKMAGVSLGELREQACSGHFSSERASWAWFAIEPFVD
jgi:hypothetical protein